MPRRDIETPRGRFHLREDGEGYPLVLLHGWPESGYCWEPVLPHLGAGFRVLRPDLRGLGDSERTPAVEPYRKRELAADVLALLDTLGVERFGLAGHDWGGAVAQEVAIAAPERVTRLAILNIHLLPNHAGHVAAEAAHGARFHRAYWYQHFMQLPGLHEALVPGREEAWLRTFLRGRDRDWAFPADAVAEYVRCYAIPGTETSGPNYYRAMRLDAPRWKELRGHRFPMPTRLIWGVHDPVVIPEYLEGHAACFAEVALTEIDASHFLMEERPEPVGRALAEHFRVLVGG